MEGRARQLSRTAGSLQRVISPSPEGMKSGRILMIMIYNKSVNELLWFFYCFLLDTVYILCIIAVIICAGRRRFCVALSRDGESVKKEQHNNNDRNKIPSNFNTFSRWKT